MKNFFRTASLSAALGVAIVGTASAVASPAAVSPDNVLAIQEVRDSTLQHARSAETLFKSVRGAYNMDDGTSLRIYRDNNVYLAQVSETAPVPVSMSRNGKFVSPDGVIEIRFLKNSGGLYDGVVLSKLNRDGTRIASAGHTSGS